MIEMGLLWYEPSRGVPLADRIDAAAEANANPAAATINPPTQRSSLSHAGIANPPVHNSSAAVEDKLLTPNTRPRNRFGTIR